jgi:two-component system sensor histidine kinase HydH
VKDRDAGKSKAELVAELKALRQRIADLELQGPASQAGQEEEPHTREALERSEQRFRSLIENASEFIVIADAHAIIQYASRSVERILGFEPAEMVGRSLFDFVHPNDVPSDISALSNLLQGPTPPAHIEVRARHKDGRWIVLAGVGSNLLDDPAVQGLVANLRDVTEWREVQDELKQRSEALMALNAISTAAVSSLDLSKVLRKILERTCFALNAETGSILLREPDKEEIFFLVSLSQGIDSIYQQRLALDQGIAGWVMQHGRGVRIDDVKADPRWYSGVDAITGFDTRSLLCVPIFHQDEILGVLEIINRRDAPFTDDDLSLVVATASITAAALENARLFSFYQTRVRELTLLNEIALQVTSILDRDGLIDTAFSLMRHLFPTDAIFLLEPDPETAVLCPTQSLAGDDSLERDVALWAAQAIAAWVMEHRRATRVKDVRYDARCAGLADRFGTTPQVTLIAAPLPVPEGIIGALLVANWRNLLYSPDDLRTLQSVASILAIALENARHHMAQVQLLKEREQAQQQLIRSEKMSALGRMASSMAHEINNPLQAIQGCLTLVQDELDGARRSQQLTRYLDVIRGEVERVAALGQQMREFYRPVREGRERTDIHNLLADLLALSSRKLRQSEIVVEQNWMNAPPPVLANPDHLKQVFLNLLFNAMDAMPGGGTLRITTAPDSMRRDTPERFGTGPLVEAICVAFSDTGVGMAPEIQARLFEPFFTTKEHGSGLGLSVSYNIIQAHNGRILVESQEGVGTTVSILLPVARDAPAQAESPPG